MLASLILLLGVMWLQRFKLIEKRYHFFTMFSEVGGLTKDDPIMINGVERGRVDGVHLDPKGVLVEMGVSDGVLFPCDSRITLRSIGIMGERFVSIKSGRAGSMVEPGDTLPGYFEAGMSEVMGEAGRVLGELVETSAHLKDVIRILTAGGKLEQSLSDLQSFSGSLKDMSDGDEAPLKNSIRRVERVSMLLDSLLTNRYSDLDSSLQSFGRAGKKMEGAADNLSDVSKDLREIISRLNAGEGTIGRLISEDDLIEKLSRTVDNLDALVEDIKKHPGRYLSIRLF